MKRMLINSSPSQKFCIVLQGKPPLKTLSITEEQYTVYGSIAKLNRSRFLPSTFLYSTLLYKAPAIKSTHSQPQNYTNP